MKKITTILAVLAIGYIIAGCAKKEEAAAPGPEGTTAGSGAGGDASKSTTEAPK